MRSPRNTTPRPEPGGRPPRTPTWVPIALFAAAWFTTAPAGPSTGSIEIEEPDRRDLLEGTVVLAATVEAPPGVGVDGVEFRVNGRLLDTDVEPPYEARWREVNTLRDHLIRATAFLSDGTRVYALRSVPVLGLVSRATVVGDAPDVVLLSTTFLDSDGQPITDVRRDEVRVYEDGRKQTIDLFVPDDRPLSVQLLLDSSDSTRPQWKDLDLATALFAETLRPDDRAGVEAFSHLAYVLAPMGSSVDAIRDATAGFQQWGGGTWLYDMLARATLFTLRHERRGRHALIILSDGDDSGSALTASEADEFLDRSDIQVHTVIWFPENTSFGGSLRKYSVVARKHRLLEAMVVATGGDQIELRDVPMEEVFLRIGERLRSQFLIGYTSLSKRARGKEREIEVRLARVGNHRVRYRRRHFGGEDLDEFVLRRAVTGSESARRIAVRAAALSEDPDALEVLVKIVQDAKQPDEGPAMDARLVFVALGPAGVRPLRDALTTKDGAADPRIARILVDLFVALRRVGRLPEIEEAVRILGGGSREAGWTVLRGLPADDLPESTRDGLRELLEGPGAADPAGG